MNDALRLIFQETERIIPGYADGIQSFSIALLIAGTFCFFIERINPAEKDTLFFKKDFRKELGLAFFNAMISVPVFTALISISILTALNQIAPPQMFSEQIGRLPLLLQIIFALIAMDLSTYWRHRFTHNYMWPYHSFHHSAEEITWLTALRLHPVDYFTAMLFDTVILYFLGFEGTGIVLATLIMQVFNYFTHLNLNVSFRKPLRYILASPHFHRWHHATDKKAYDKNFCAMFSFLDIIFGTYYHPETLPGAYGLSPAEQKQVPKKLAPHVWQPIKKDMKKLSGFFTKKT